MTDKETVGLFLKRDESALETLRRRRAKKHGGKPPFFSADRF